MKVESKIAQNTEGPILTNTIQTQKKPPHQVTAFFKSKVIRTSYIPHRTSIKVSLSIY
jgi:hypothetical protein